MHSAVVLCLFVLTTHPMLGSQAQEDLDKKLQAEVSGYTVAEDSFVQALTKVASDFKLPMGIEWVRDPGTVGKVNLSLRHTTVRSVIETLVATQKGYDSRKENGVVHIFQREVGSGERNFLNLTVEKFEVRNEFVGMASQDLRALVKRTVSPPRIVTGGGEGRSYGAGIGERRVSFKLEKVTVRNILDYLLPLAGFKVWIVTFGNTSSLTPTGFYRTTSLWNPGPLPDQEQPVWDLYIWGATLPGAAPARQQ
jgi:hypothetical protein